MRAFFLVCRHSPSSCVLARQTERAIIALLLFSAGQQSHDEGCTFVILLPPRKASSGNRTVSGIRFQHANFQGKLSEYSRNYTSSFVTSVCHLVFKVNSCGSTSFRALLNIRPLSEYAMFCLPLHWVIDTWVVSRSLLLRITLPCMCFHGDVSFLSGIDPEVGLLGPYGTLCLTQGTAKLFFRQTTLFYIPLAITRVPNDLHPCRHLLLPAFLITALLQLGSGFAL